MSDNLYPKFSPFDAGKQSSSARRYSPCIVKHDTRFPIACTLGTDWIWRGLWIIADTSGLIEALWSLIPAQVFLKVKISFRVSPLSTMAISMTIPARTDMYLHKFPYISSQHSPCFENDSIRLYSGTFLLSFSS